MKKWTRKNKYGFGQIRILRSGRFQAQYKAPDGAYYKAPNTFEFEDLAERWLSDEQHRIRVAELTNTAWKSPQAREQEGITVSELIDLWLDNSPTLTKESSRASHRRRLNARVLQGHGMIRVAPTAVRKKEGFTPRRSGKGGTPTPISRQLPSAAFVDPVKSPEYWT